jgi:hypothetical protein
MKNWTWKKWTALSIISASVIGFGICHLVQPNVSYAWLEIVSACTFILGGIAGYLICKEKQKSTK